MAELVRVSCRLANSKLMAEHGPQILYAVTDIVPVGEGAPAAGPVNVSFVLDRSGSMAGEKIDNLRRAVKLALDLLDPDDIVSIVLFDDRVEVLAPASPVRDKESLKRRVDQIRDRGGTEISKGMEAGLNELDKYHTPDRVSRMILLTDGQTYGDEDQCLEWAKQLAEKKIPLIAFGLGDDWNEDFLDRLANVTAGAGGLSEFIDAPEKIVDFFERVVAGAKRVVVRDAWLTVRLIPGVTPQRVWRVRPLIGLLGATALSDRGIQVALGDLERDQGQSLLMELTVQKKPKGVFRIAQVEVGYRTPAGQEERVRQDLAVEFTTDAEEAKKVDEEVRRLVKAVTAHRLQTKALEEAARGGDRTRAKDLLMQATILLRDLGNQELADQAQQEAERLGRGEEMSPTGTKRLRYETRRLTS